MDGGLVLILNTLLLDLTFNGTSKFSATAADNNDETKRKDKEKQVHGNALSWIICKCHFFCSLSRKRFTTKLLVLLSFMSFLFATHSFSTKTTTAATTLLPLLEGLLGSIAVQCHWSSEVFLASYFMELHKWKVVKSVAQADKHHHMKWKCVEVLKKITQELII